jgi:hypothetical protein
VSPVTFQLRVSSSVLKNALLPVHPRVQARAAGRGVQAEAQGVAAQLVGASEAVAAGAAVRLLLHRVEQQVRLGDVLGDRAGWPATSAVS